MKARIKATGEIVDVDECSILYEDGKRELMYGKELEEVEGTPDYWTRLEHQYAGMAMQGMLSNQTVIEAITNCKATMERVIPLHAYRFAHALVEKYKKEK